MCIRDRYYRDPEVLDSPYGARYVGEMDRLFEAYAELLPVMQAWLTRRFPRAPGDSDFVHRQSIKAKALDSLRGLLPTASVSNVGIYGTGQSYEQLILRMRAHPLPEARRYAEMMLEELRKVIPSFLQRLDRPERGGVWAAYMASTRCETESIVERLWPDAHDSRQPDAPLVRLVDHDPQGEDKVLAAMCFSSSSLEESELLRRVDVYKRQPPHRGIDVETVGGCRGDLQAVHIGHRRQRVHRRARVTRGEQSVLFCARRVPEADAQKEPVSLAVGKQVGPRRVEGVLRGYDHEGGGQREALAVHADLTFLHRLEQGRLSLR